MSYDAGKKGKRGKGSGFNFGAAVRGSGSSTSALNPSVEIRSQRRSFPNQGGLRETLDTLTIATASSPDDVKEQYERDLNFIAGSYDDYVTASKFEGFNRLILTVCFQVKSNITHTQDEINRIEKDITDGKEIKERRADDLAEKSRFEQQKIKFVFKIQINKKKMLEKHLKDLQEVQKLTDEILKDTDAGIYFSQQQISNYKKQFSNLEKSCDTLTSYVYPGYLEDVASCKPSEKEKQLFLETNKPMAEKTTTSHLVNYLIEDAQEFIFFDSDSTQKPDEDDLDALVAEIEHTNIQDSKKPSENKKGKKNRNRKKKPTSAVASGSRTQETAAPASEPDPAETPVQIDISDNPFYILEAVPIHTKSSEPSQKQHHTLAILGQSKFYRPKVSRPSSEAVLQFDIDSPHSNFAPAFNIRVSEAALQHIKRRHERQFVFNILAGFSDAKQKNIVTDKLIELNSESRDLILSGLQGAITAALSSPETQMKAQPEIKDENGNIIKQAAIVIKFPLSEKRDERGMCLHLQVAFAQYKDRPIQGGKPKLDLLSLYLPYGK